MDLADGAVSVIAYVEFESYLCFAAAIADDVLIAGLLVWPYYSAKQSVEYRVEDRGLSALVEAGDKDDSVGESQRLGKLELFEILSLETDEFQLTPSSCNLAIVSFHASCTIGRSSSLTFATKF